VPRHGTRTELRYIPLAAPGNYGRHASISSPSVSRSFSRPSRSQPRGTRVHSARSWWGLRGGHGPRRGFRGAHHASPA